MDPPPANRNPMSTAKITNVTFDEIEIGATASMSRPVSQTALEVLALLSGDVDPFVLQGNGLEEVRPDASSTEAAGAEALIAAVLGAKLPGPGMRIVRQDLSYRGVVHTGDRLTATVRVQGEERRASRSRLSVPVCQPRRGDAGDGRRNGRCADEACDV